MTAPRVLYCHCAYAQVIPPQVKADVLQKLADSGASFEAVADLCEMSARKDPALERLASPDGELRIAACYDRAVKWLFSAAEVPLPDEGVRVCNMRVDSADEVVSALLEETPEASEGE